MGCGKSSVGRELSRLLCCSFMDLDDVIAEAENRSIPEIFATDGEAAFRRMELKALQTLLCSGWPKTKSLPRLSRGPRPFTRPRAATVFDSPCTEQYDNIVMILALGGGTVMTPECAELVKANTLCVYLRASVDTLMEHLSGEADGRPMLQGDSLRSRIEELMVLRSETYERTAHIIIDTDGKTIDEIAQQIKTI